MSHSAHGLTDGGGLLLVRRLWDQLQLGARIDQRTPAIDQRFRSSLFIEVWVAMLLYGGSVMDDLTRFAGRGIQRLFGWRAVPDPTTFGRWLRRGGPAMITLLDDLLWTLVRARWAAVGQPTSLVLILDSTVVMRYGLTQAGAVRGYNPTKPGRPSHHPLLAFTDGGDCLGVRWRAGDAHTAAGATAWLRTLIARLRAHGVRDIIVRLDKGFFAREMVDVLMELEVAFVLKVSDHSWVRRALGSYRQSAADPELWTATGELYGVRLCSVERRRAVPATPDAVPPAQATQTTLALDTYEVTALETDDRVAHVLTNIPGLTAVRAWRLYNQGAVVEQRIKECYQLGFGHTAVDDLDGNAILAGLGVLAYQVLHVIRTTALTGAWRRAQPATLRAWVFRLPAKTTMHARKGYVRLLNTEPLRRLVLHAMRALTGLAPPAALVGMH